MLLKPLLWKLFSIVVALTWVQVQIRSQDYLMNIAKTAFELIKGNQPPVNPTSACDNTTNNVSWTDHPLSLLIGFKNVRRHEGTFGGHNSDNGLLNVTAKTEVPGIIYESPQRVWGQWERFVRRAPKCTWSGRLGFKMPIFHSPSPGHLSRALSTLLDGFLNLGVTFNDFRLKYSPVACRIGRYILWEQNAPVELGVAWSVAIILYAGICWYERRRHKAAESLGKNWREELRAKIREAIPDMTTPEDSESDDEDVDDDDDEENFF